MAPLVRARTHTRSHTHTHTHARTYTPHDTHASWSRAAGRTSHATRTELGIEDTWLGMGNGMVEKGNNYRG